MDFKKYYSPKIEMNNTLLARTFVLKDKDLKQTLKHFYGDENPIISKHQESMLWKNISSKMGDKKLKEYFAIGYKLDVEIFSQLERFLMDLSLSISLYENITDYINEIPLMDKANRKSIGEIPFWEFDRIPFIYAHAFLDAIIKISNTIAVMSEEKKTPYIPIETRGKLIRIKEEFDKDFPKVRDIRNSWQHIEDRMRGKGRSEKKLNTKLLVLSTFIGNELTYTIVDGSVHSIPITIESFEKAKSYVSKAINAFEWIEGTE